jgi:chitinase
MSLTNEADILDVVRRLRKTIGELDNINFLVDKVKTLGEFGIDTTVERAANKIAAASLATAALLKQLENNKTYKTIVKQYRSPSMQEEEDDNGRVQED